MKTINRQSLTLCFMYALLLVLQIATVCILLTNRTYCEIEIESQIEFPAIEFVDVVDEWEDYRSKAINLVNDLDVINLAKLTYGEAGGIPSLMEKAAVMWCACNRADMYNCSISKVASNRSIFHGYSVNNPITDELRNLAIDVLTRYYMEKLGKDDVGRILPKTYLYFHGDGKHNHFREEYNSRVYYSWYLENPYES